MQNNNKTNKKSSNILKATLLLCSMMTMMAGAIIAPSLPQINQVFSDVPHSELLSRLVLTIPALFIAFLAPVAGYFVDMYGRKRVLLISLFLYGISGTSGFYLNNLYWILAGRAVLGVAVAGIMTTAVTLVGDYFKGEERSSFFGIQGAFMGLGGVLFITISGWLADIQWQLPFLIYCFSFFVLILSAIFIYEPDIKKETNVSQTFSSTDIDYNKSLAILILVIVFIGIAFFYMMPVQVPFLLKRLEGVNNSMVGYAISISTLASAIVSMNYRRIKSRLSFRQMYAFVFLFIGTGYALVSQSIHYWHYITGLIISGVGIGLLMPTGNLWMMEIAPTPIRGRLIGRVTTATFLGQFFSPVLVQPLVSSYSLPIAFLVAGLTMLALSLFFFSFKKIKRFAVSICRSNR